ncbi:MAG: hypothetical protein HBSAPP04_24730 [Ignavibacteriaceae bacterium]|nr:MAG: biopolymer transporter ExbD [Chlorobiota bacterium]GJQ33634.1 MAG: hypothetical protein HBSAPP04_24730 [Ignavibacteriaceae bacterium]
MSLIRRRRKGLPDVPLASMSDIAFLLLIFFIVAATIDVDTGISLSLPAYDPKEAPAQVERSRVIEVKIVSEEILLNGSATSVSELVNVVASKARESVKLPEEEKPVTLILYSGKVPYGKYISVLDNVKRGYRVVQDEISRQEFGRSYRTLSEEERSTVSTKVPVLITVGELKNND